jgi:CSLREA domain-containing protein
VKRETLRKIHVIIVFLSIIAFSTASGAVLIVTTPEDEIGDPDTCSLREAIIAANQNADFDGCIASTAYGFDQIEFDPAIEGEVIRLTLVGSGEDAAFTGDLDITDSLKIVGAGSGTEISGDADPNSAVPTDRVFDIRLAPSTPFPAVVDLELLRVTNGRPPAAVGVPEVCGGGIRVASGSSLTVFNSVVTDNSIVMGMVPLRGAGICVDGALSLLTSEVSDNTLSGSNTLFGAGVAVDGGTLLASTSRIRFNSVNGSNSTVYGGGIAARNGARVTVVRSELSSNNASSLIGDAFGGGLFAVNGTQVTVSNSTISDNQVLALDSISAREADGGAFFIDLDGGGTLQMGNITVFDNKALAPNGASAMTAGVNALNGVVEIANTIIGGNFSNSDLFDCSNGDQWSSLGYNLVQRNCDIVPAAGDLFSVDPLLGPLSVSGIVFPLIEQPASHAPLAGSAAIDAGNPTASNTFPDCLPRDQREFVRVGINGPVRCDMGAHEYLSPGLPSIFSDGFEE